MILEQRHAVRVQIFHVEQAFRDLFAYVRDISVISGVRRWIEARQSVAQCGNQALLAVIRPGLDRPA
jgi:hypothetical protein